MKSVHTYIHPSIHTSMHACMHQCINAYMHQCIHAYMHTYINTCMTYRLTDLLTYLPTYLPLRPYIRTYIHVHPHIYVDIFICTRVCVYIYTHDFVINMKILRRFSGSCCAPQILEPPKQLVFLTNRPMFRVSKQTHDAEKPWRLCGLMKWRLPVYCLSIWCHKVVTTLLIPWHWIWILALKARYNPISWDKTLSCRGWQGSTVCSPSGGLWGL